MVLELNLASISSTKAVFKVSNFFLQLNNLVFFFVEEVSIVQGSYTSHLILNWIFYSLSHESFNFLLQQNEALVHVIFLLVFENDPGSLIGAKLVSEEQKNIFDVIEGGNVGICFDDEVLG